MAGIQIPGFIGFIVRAVIAWIIYSSGGATIKKINVVTSCILGIDLVKYLIPCLIIFVFFPFLIGWIITIIRWIIEKAKHVKSKIEEVSKGDWRMVWGIAFMVLSVLKFFRLFIFAVNCDGCGKWCSICFIGTSVLGIALFVWSLSDMINKKKKEGILDFLQLAKERKKQIIINEEAALMALSRYPDISRISAEFAEAVREKKILDDAEMKGKPLKRPTYPEFDEVYKVKKTEFINALIRKKRIVGQAYHTSKEKLKAEELGAEEITKIQANMTLGAFAKKIEQEMERGIPVPDWLGLLRKLPGFKKKTDFSYDYEEYWA